MWHSPFIIPVLALSIPIVAILGGVYTKTLTLRAEERRAERLARATVSEEDAQGFARTVERLEARLKVLEAILDDEVPGWRRTYDD